MPRATGVSLSALARYRHPGRGARWLEALVGHAGWTELRRRVCTVLPVPRLRSDVVDVAYATWWVDVTAMPTPPSGTRYWQHAGRTPFTVLTYRHGHFGPASAGLFRRGFPPPLQSNWRGYVLADDAPVNAAPTVLFAANVMDSVLHVIGARLSSDAMQPQLAARFRHDWRGGVLETRIDPGGGAAPALHTCLRAVDSPPPADADWWRGAFAGREAALRFLACQDTALAVAPDGRVAWTRISLPVDEATLEPLEALRIECEWVGELGGDVGHALCFRLPRVRFEVVSERLL